MTLTEDSVYVHAGAATNLDAVKQDLPAQSPRMFQNTGRLETHLEQIEDQIGRDRDL